jgi:hypothetical protein
MKEVTIKLTEKMDATVEAFKEIWKGYSEEEVMIELLKNGIEHYMGTYEKSEDGEYKIITKVMKSNGYTGKRIWDME